MEIANARLRLNKFGSDVPVKDMTPAEALVLHVLHQANNGGSTFGEEFEKIDIKGEAQTVTGMTDGKVIPAVPAQPAIEGRPAIAGKPAVAYKPAVEPVAYRAAVLGKPAIAAQLAVGNPGEPGYKPAVEAVAAMPFQPEVKEVKAQPEVPAQEAVAAIPAIEAGAAVEAISEQVIPPKPIERPRTDVEEFRRLTAKYGRNVNKKGERILKLIWPEMSPKLPQKFSELDWKNLNYDGVEVGAVNYITGTPVATK